MNNRSAKEIDATQLSDEGFTLIELLIVIVVLGILAAVVVFSLGSVTGDARMSACNADAKTIVTAVEAYNAQNAPNVISWETYAASATAGLVTPGNPNTFGAATQAVRLSNTSLVNTWPGVDPYYAFALATGPSTDANSDAALRGAKAGDVVIYAPSGTTTLQVDYNAEVLRVGNTPGTGCDSL